MLMFDKNKFGKSIRNYRKSLGLSNYNFAIAANINYTHLSNIESGKKAITAKTAISILNILNLTFSECMEDSTSHLKEVYKNVISSSLDQLEEHDMDFILNVAKSFNANIEVTKWNTVKNS